MVSSVRCIDLDSLLMNHLFWLDGDFFLLLGLAVHFPLYSFVTLSCSSQDHFFSSPNSCTSQISATEPLVSPSWSRKAGSMEHKGWRYCRRREGPGRKAYPMSTVVSFTVLHSLPSYCFLLGQRNGMGKGKRGKKTFLSQLFTRSPLFPTRLQGTLCCLLLLSQYKQNLLCHRCSAEFVE